MQDDASIDLVHHSMAKPLNERRGKADSEEVLARVEDLAQAEILRDGPAKSDRAQPVMLFWIK